MNADDTEDIVRGNLRRHRFKFRRFFLTRAATNYDSSRHFLVKEKDYFKQIQEFNRNLIIGVFFGQANIQARRNLRSNERNATQRINRFAVEKQQKERESRRDAYLKIGITRVSEWQVYLVVIVAVVFVVDHEFYEPSRVESETSVIVMPAR